MAEHHTRDFLATLLWPDSGASQARRSLRNRLSELKSALGPEWIAADRESVGLQAGFWLDVAEFQKRLNDIDDAQNLAAAAALYRADFLSGFTLPDSPGYDEWQFFQTESLRQSLAAALDKLIAELSKSDERETAVAHARRRLALDPLHEPAQRQLMLLYARSGQQAAALRQYELCTQTLADELGLEPDSRNDRTLPPDT